MQRRFYLSVRISRDVPLKIPKHTYMLVHASNVHVTLWILFIDQWLLLLSSACFSQWKTCNCYSHMYLQLTEIRKLKRHYCDTTYLCQLILPLCKFLAYENFKYHAKNLIRLSQHIHYTVIGFIFNRDVWEILQV